MLRGIFAVIFAASIVVANAQNANDVEQVNNAATTSEVVEQKPEIDDFEYTLAVYERTFHHDYRSIKLDGEEKATILESRRNNGFEFGPMVGADMFNEVWSPAIGGEAGYHGKRFSLWASAYLTRSQYNEESSRAGEGYLTTNFSLDAGLRLFDLPSRYVHQREVWLIGSFGYKLRKNENKYEIENTIGTLDHHIKGSSMTYGVGVKIDFKNYMKANNFYVKAICYTGHEYMPLESEIKVGAMVSLGWNFVVPSRHSYNKKAINKVFGSMESYKSEVRELKAHKRAATY